jgi:hypothetical protein
MINFNASSEKPTIFDDHIFMDIICLTLPPPLHFRIMPGASHKQRYSVLLAPRRTAEPWFSAGRAAPRTQIVMIE